MNAIIEYFNTLEHRPLDRLAFLAGSILILWFIEGGIPLIKLRYQKGRGRHAAINFAFTLVHLVTHALLAVFVVLISDWCMNHDFGVVNWLNLPVWAVVVAGVLSMDFFGGWLVHIAEHKVPFFWRMHIVHHTDNKVDVTTGLRHHPFEAVFRWIFFMGGIIVMGLPMYAIMIGQTFMSMFTMFSHANIRLPKWLNNAMKYVFITPDAHKVHHHWKQPFTDSNYGTALSIWDRMFGTYRELDTDQIKYGLDRYYDNAKDEDMIELLKSPFRPLKKGREIVAEQG